MKKPWWIYALTILGTVILTALCGALLFVEFRALFAGVQTLYENEPSQYFRYLFRIMGFFLILANAIFTLVAWKKMGALMTVSLIFNIGAISIALISFFFYEWYIGLGLTVGCLCVMAPETIHLLHSRIFMKNED